MAFAAIGSELNTGIIRTNDKCRGCNKCLNTCPVFGANIARENDGENRIYVDSDKCILCGRCISACSHNAREFVDDTERFFSDLSDPSADGISLLVAPSFMVNYPTRYRKILGYLKHLGAKRVFSVSFGADISVWGYLKHLSQTTEKGMISQPCPAIVNSIELHHPNLLQKLMPIQSPAMCAAVYLKKYLKIGDKLAFIGPCVAKKSEFERFDGDVKISYNVTFQHLLQHLQRDDVDLSMYDSDDSEIEYGMGALFPVQGGMRENLEYYLGLDAERYINQKEGEDHSYSYLNLYDSSIDYDDPYRAQLIDIINCSRGCNYGTATEFSNSSSNHIPHSINHIRHKKLTESFPERGDTLSTPQERLEALNARFSHLNIDDFRATYADRSCKNATITKQELADTFKSMLKFTRAEQTMDCSSCGMRSCEEMATAIAMGYNYKENCTHYIKKKLIIEENESLIQKQKLEILQASRSQAANINIDTLTGFSNRYGFEIQMESSLQQSHRTASPGYLLLMDLDDFKSINEGYGPDYGNSLLSAIAIFLKTKFGDYSHIFRFGGDEFAIILENCTTADAHRLTDIILQRTQKAWDISGVRIYSTVSIGVARFPNMDEGANDILRNVELAMYAAKREGKNSCVFYSSEIQHDAQDSIETIRAMRDAVGRDFDGFSLACQPWVDQSGKIVGCEGLMRWANQGENVSPGVFIPLAEQTGLINPLGDFILCSAAIACREINTLLPDFTVSVNVSTKQLEKADVYSRVTRLLKQIGMNMNNVVLEVTESAQLEDTSANKKLLERFVDQGLRIALDDFGTGYSALSYLNHFPFSIIKMDRSFIKSIGTDPYYEHMLRMVTDLTHKMGRTMLVEGVETEQQLEFCRKSGVDLIQGYYYYKPMPFEELKALLKKQNDL